MSAEPITSLTDPLDPVEEVDEEERSTGGPGGHRVVWLGAVVMLVMFLLWARLYQLQIVQGGDYRDQADNNRFREIIIPSPRGVIYDRNQVVLARNKPSYSVGIVPADLTDPAERAAVLERLAGLLNVPADSLRSKAAAADSPFSFVPLAMGVPEPVAFQIEERHRDLPGVTIRLLPAREYPLGSITAPILGYIGRISDAEYQRMKDDSVHRYAPDDVIGQTGLERTFESQLRGAPGQEQMEVDATGREVQSLQVTNPTAGHNLVLSIDSNLQRTAAEVLGAGIDRYQTASVVALDPRNGQVLAMVHEPSYDDNLFAEGISESDYSKLIQDPRHPLLNGAIAATYAPGGTFDPITAVAGLDSGVVTPTAKIDCPGSITVPNRFDPTLGTKLFDLRAFGAQDPESAVADGCKVFWYEVGGGEPSGKWAGVGVDGLARYAQLFGLGDRTGIDLVEEEAGLVPSVRWKRQNFNQEWVPMDTYQFAVGEGFVSATPVQMANVAAAIANGGTLYRPQLVYQVLDDNGKVVTDYTPDVIRHLGIKPADLAIVRQGMIDATGAGQTKGGFAFDGNAKQAAVPGLSVGGMTGTVEFGVPDKNGNLPTHGWFIGFAPADKPTIALAVFVDYGNGATDAATIARQIFAAYLKPGSAGG